jgi:MFS family permease
LTIIEKTDSPHKHREIPSGLTKEQTRKSIWYSMLDAVAGTTASGLTGSYITPFALTLQATTQQIGYLASIPNFMNMLVQLFAPMISERVGSRKALIVPAVFIQALMWLPILAIPYLFQTNQVWWLIVFFSVSTIVGGLSSPPWNSIMADLLPPEIRGNYFGMRNRITSFVTLLFSFVTAGLLQVLTGNTRLAFTIVFAGAAFSRMISVYALSHMTEPHPALTQSKPKDSIPQISRSLFSTNIGRFIIFFTFLNLAQNIDAPFFSAYLLKELQVSYISYQIITATMAVMTIFVVAWWGKHAGKAGNLKILHITALMIPFVSLLWILNSSVAWLCAVQVYSGFAWAGFNLCAGLFVFDAAPQDNRTRYVALLHALGALGITLGAVIGGNLGPRLPRISGSYFLTLFLVAGIVKLIIVLGLFRRISEVRNVPPIRVSELFFGIRRNKMP